MTIWIVEMRWKDNDWSPCKMWMNRKDARDCAKFNTKIHKQIKSTALPEYRVMPYDRREKK